MFSPSSIHDCIRHSLRPLLLALVSATVLIQLAFPSRPSAAMFNTITVTSLADDTTLNGNCTLREAIQAAQSNTSVDACTAGAAGLDIIQFNVGSGVPTISLTSPLPTITSPVTINGNTGGATRIELNGTNAGANTTGLRVMDTSNCTFQSLVINRFGLNGISVETSDNCVVNDCIIGLNPAADTDQGNGGQGISIKDSSNTIIGGTAASNRNIISGNALSGIEIKFTSIASNNSVLNNIIGTNAAGATGLGNSQNGVIVDGAQGTIIGGSLAERNIISGNTLAGIAVLAADGTTIRSNIIGANSTGTSAVPNGSGISLDSATSSNIGGGTVNDGNLISGNTGAGILVMAASNFNNIEGNLIGTKLDGTSALGNGSHGISFPNGTSASNRIEGFGASSNTIAFNGGAGISLFAGGNNNRISGNSIFANAGLGIDLGTAGVTPNDNGDTDTGPNGLLNFPILLSLAGNTISGELHVGVNANTNVEFFANATCDASGNGEGEVFLGSQFITTDNSGFATFMFPYTPVAGKPVITAVVINAETSDTSEFSACLTPPCPSISVLPPTLSNATTGTNFSQNITASGGTGAYSFAVTAGTLPGGLTLTPTGLLSGTPTQAGVFNFDITATDANFCTGKAGYSLVVTCPQIPASITAPATAIAGQNLSYSVTLSNPCPNLTLNSTLTIPIPSNTTFQSISSVAGWTCSTPAVGGTGTISCTNPSFAPIANPPNVPRLPVSFTVVLNVNSGTPLNTIINHSATIVGNFPGLPINTQTAIGSTTVGVIGGAADLSVTNSTSSSPIAGTNTTFNITVTNNTAATSATGVTLTNAIPTNTTFQSLTSPAGWTCTTPAVGGTGTITCSVATLANGSVNFALVVRLNSNVLCDTTISDTASVQSVPPDPTPGNNSATASTLAKAQSDLAVNVVAPTNAVPDVSAIYTVTVSNLGPSNSANSTLSNLLPAAFSAEAINTSAGTCTGIGSNTVNCTLGTLAAGATATITIQVHVPETCQPTTAINTAAVVSGNCLADPIAANNSQTQTSAVQIGNLGPGSCIPSNQPPNDNKPGSVLFGGVFASGASGGPGGDPGNNTAVSLTNVHPRLGVVVHLFFVDGATCSVADSFVCLTPNQTTRFLMSDLDPGVAGYMMAMAVDGPAGTAGGHNTGCPISFNYLIGSARIKMTNSPRREAELASESCASEFGSPLPGCDPNKSFAEIPFDGSPRGFNKLPLVLAASNIASRADGNDTMLMLARIDGNWGTGLKPLGNIFGILYDDAENAYSFNFNVGTCLLRTILSNNFPRTAPRFEQAIPAGRSGWMRLWSADNAAIMGAIINRNDNTSSLPNAFDGGHNLHVLRLNPGVVVTVPVFPPSC